METRTELAIGVALNPNGRGFNSQMKRLERKIEKGAQFVQTQPVYDIERIKEMVARTRALGIPTFLGVFPLLSYSNAAYIHNEVPGIDVPDAVLQRLKGLSKKEGARVGMAIVEEIIDEVIGLVDGFYVIPTFNRVKLALELIEHIRSRALQAARPA